MLWPFSSRLTGLSLNYPKWVQAWADRSPRFVTFPQGFGSQHSAAWHGLTLEPILKWSNFPQVLHSAPGIKVLWWKRRVAAEASAPFGFDLTFFTPRFAIWGLETQPVAIQTGRWWGLFKALSKRLKTTCQCNSVIHASSGVKLWEISSWFVFTETGNASEYIQYPGETARPSN